jgi:hypothetical protein
VSELKASKTLVGALKDKLDRPELVERFVASFQRRVSALQRQGSGAPDETARRVRECERRVANLTESLAKVGWSEALASKLRDEENLLAKLRAERSTAKREAPRVVPHPTAVATYLKDLFPLLDTDPVRGRELLSRFVAPVVMTPKTEGPVRHYRATGAFNLSFLMSAAASGGNRIGKSGCAGRI